MINTMSSVKWQVTSSEGGEAIMDPTPCLIPEGLSVASSSDPSCGLRKVYHIR